MIRNFKIINLQPKLKYNDYNSHYTNSYFMFSIQAIT